jgi:hypothetical protein
MCKFIAFQGIIPRVGKETIAALLILAPGARWRNPEFRHNAREGATWTMTMATWGESKWFSTFCVSLLSLCCLPGALEWWWCSPITPNWSTALTGFSAQFPFLRR